MVYFLIMGKINNLTNDQIKELITSELSDMGIGHATFKIQVVDGPKVLLDGEIESEHVRDVIAQAISDVTGIADIVDGLIVVRELEDPHFHDELYYHDDEIYDEDDEFIGTEDAFQSVEDGIPYIPPTGSASHDTYEELQKRERKRKKRLGR